MNNIRPFFLIFALVLSSAITKAQSDYNYSPFGIGVGASVIHGYTNVAKQNNTLAVSLDFTYYPSPYVPVTAEVQRGRLWGGSRITDPSKREYENNYTAVIFHGDLQWGELIDYEDNFFFNFIKNGYVGTGLGFIYSNVKNQRTNLIPDSEHPVGTYVFPGKDHSINTIFPVRIGYEIKLYNEYDEPFIRLNFGVEQNIVFGEGLDGYNDPSSRFKNENPDQYSQVYINIKYTFGQSTSFTKRIRGTSF